MTTNITSSSLTAPDLTDTDIHNILTDALGKIIKRIDLTQAQMRAVMRIIMDGRCPDALLSALLVGLNMKGESIDEITAAASVMLEFADKISLDGCDYLVDIVGTGGDGSNLFNVSTASAFVAAAAGATVAKHGNRGVSSKSGSSDLLQQAGIELDITHEQTKRCIETQGLGFLFAPNHHKAMKHAIAIRRLLKIRTLFNILGPLTNPAGVKNSVIGVFTDTLCEPLAYVLKNLGANHVMVVGSKDGLDEISLASSTKVAELKDGEVQVYEIYPEDVGIESQSLTGLTVASSQQSLALIQAALAGAADTSGGAANNQEGGATQPFIHPSVVNKARAMIALNAGAAIYVAGLASNLANGINQAQTIIQAGSALQKMTDFAHYTQTLPQAAPAIPSILQQIIASKQLEVTAAKQRQDFASIKSAALALAASQDLPEQSVLEQGVPNQEVPRRGFAAALRQKQAAGAVAVIAEIKKASPSKGVICQNFDPALIAQQYAAAGATCLSVLTDAPYFQGANRYLAEAKQACALPVLRKDFMIDAYQIYESYLLGADCVLLIVACLADKMLHELHRVACQLGMDVLIEVHTEQELQRALRLPQSPHNIYGINNRDLHTFQTDLHTSIQLHKVLASQTNALDSDSSLLVVAESGIHSADDVRLMLTHHIHCLLIGEQFMKTPHPGQALAALLTTV